MERSVCPIRGFVIVLLVAFFAMAAAGRAGSEAVPEERYWRLVEETLTVLEEVSALEGEDQRTALQDLADRWEAMTGVVLTSGEILALDTSYLSAQLRAENPAPSHLVALFENLLANRVPVPNGPDASAQLKVLDAILARPEFQYAPPATNPLAQIWTRLLTWSSEILERFFPGAGGFLRSINLGLAIGITAAAALVVIFLYIVRRAYREIVAETGEERHGMPDGNALTADLALRQANELSGQGDNRAAVRYLYLSALLRLEERGLLKYDRSKTNREYLGALSEQPDVRSDLRSVVEVFDRVWYGFQEIEQQDFQRYAAQVANLRERRSP